VWLCEAGDKGFVWRTPARVVTIWGLLLPYMMGVPASPAIGAPSPRGRDSLVPRRRETGHNCVRPTSKQKHQAASSTSPTPATPPPRISACRLLFALARIASVLESFPSASTQHQPLAVSDDQ
jgi:hypothetical protein